jgi:hypothetical protein
MRSSDLTAKRELGEIVAVVHVLYCWGVLVDPLRKARFKPSQTKLPALQRSSRIP